MYKSTWSVYCGNYVFLKANPPFLTKNGGRQKKNERFFPLKRRCVKDQHRKRPQYQCRALDRARPLMTIYSNYYRYGASSRIPWATGYQPKPARDNTTKTATSSPQDALRGNNLLEFRIFCAIITEFWFFSFEFLVSIYLGLIGYCHYTVANWEMVAA